MSNPHYFRRRAIKYRELADNLLYAKHGDELRDIADLFDRMADSVREHDVAQSRIQHRQIIAALDSALLGWTNEIGSVM